MRRWNPAVAIITLVAAGFFLTRPAPGLGNFKMPDGTVVEVVKITTGPAHRFRYGNRLQDFLASALPKTLRAKLKPHILEFTATNASSIGIWTKSYGPVLGSTFEVTVADESGIEVPVGATKVTAVTTTNTSPPESKVYVRGWLLAPLPHHAREIGLGFHYLGAGSLHGWGRFGYLKLPNPAYRSGQPVPHESLPLVKSAEDIEVKLIRADAERNRWSNPTNARVTWRVAAEIMRNGVPFPDWELERIEVLADGELFARTEPSREFQLDSNGIGFFTAEMLGAHEPPIRPILDLWPDAVWTLRLRVAQRINSTPNSYSPTLGTGVRDVRSVEFHVKPTFVK